MSDLFGRVATLQMGTIKITGLRVSFTVTMSAEPEPDSAEISVYNLSETTRALIKEQTLLPLILEVGYGRDIEQLFSGDFMPAGIHSVKDGKEWVTVFKAGDGLTTHKSARIQKSFAKGALLKTVLGDIVKTMGTGVSKAQKQIAEGNFTGAAEQFISGVVVSGSSSKELDRMLAPSGHGYRIDAGQVDIFEKGTANDEEAVSLSSETGLIGNPEPGKDGFTKFRSLLRPRLKPRTQAQLVTETYNGFYVVSRVTHNGDTYGPNWYSDCEAKAA